MFALKFLSDFFNVYGKGDALVSYTPFFIFLLVFVPLMFASGVFVDYLIGKILRK
ncbi:MAG: hypothetical protein ACK40G_15000 [Cytophagaceae bacterium]